MSPSEETTCPKEIAESPPSLFQNGNIVFQSDQVGWVVSGSFAVIATITSVWLVNRHLQWYNNKREQRYIVRILFMVPIYATISFASYLFWNHSTPLLLIRDAYEAIVLTAFFYLLLMYISPDTEEQKKVFLKCGLSREADIITERKGEKLSRWVFPMGFVKWKPADGLYFLQLMKWGVLQYCVIRPLTTLAAVILDYAGLYCEESWGLEWGHVYITIIISLSVTIAMYCLIQLYVPISSHLVFHKPLLKLFAIKAVVFLTFWQATFLSVLSMFGVVKDTKYMTAEDINIGIGALLETFEMMLFAFLHIRAFTYKAYRPIQSSHSRLLLPQPTPRLRSLGHAIDFRETFREIWVGCVYMFDKMCGRQPTTDLGVLRTAHYETAFGLPRGLQLNREKNSVTPSKKVRNGRATLPAVEVEVDEAVEYEVEGERQWLGVGNDYGYGIGYLQREKSEGLEVQIERELKKRGYNTHAYEAVTDQDRKTAQHQGKRSSWWRTIYDRISQSDAENRQDLTTSHKLPKGTRGSHSRHQSHYSERP
ncbi:organic solute transporter Ostalpha-domain-containing protein [Crucibulum laeve]|uniref:Organic solute transporter Ostalpha-domain-containing protein n=1 Tax=Crucibulum laeve TaxID=68775 RepID=A0A5C3MGB4_9AGAR|nr:organic solute transporter Ostalpha-domain-containing protein [Crucibulum laeve]